MRASSVFSVHNAKSRIRQTLILYFNKVSVLALPKHVRHMYPYDINVKNFLLKILMIQNLLDVITNQREPITGKQAFLQYIFIKTV